MKADLRRARSGHGIPVQQGTQMLIVGVVCDHGVRGVLHEGAFEPLNELTLEVTNVSIIGPNGRVQGLWWVQGAILTSSVAVEVS